MNLIPVYKSCINPPKVSLVALEWRRARSVLQVTTASRAAWPGPVVFALRDTTAQRDRRPVDPNSMSVQLDITARRSVTRHHRDRA